jgi:ribosomal protein L7/L12
MSGISTSQEGQIKELVAKGQKVAAVKLYREMTGVGLAEAKDAVEALQSGESLIIPTPVIIGEPDPFLENRIKRLLAERKKIEAVKVYREAYKCGLKDAKDAVDLIQVEMRREGYSNLPSTPAISDDPFAEDTQRNRSCLILAVALSLVLLGGLAFFLFMRRGF